MVQYRYAKDQEGLIVSADEIAKKPVTKQYWCFGCGEELIAKVNGELVQPHFAHKSHAECSPESYLHRLAKRAFRETYERCLAEGRPYLVTLEVARVCRKFSPVIMPHCELGTATAQHDLTKYFTIIREEARDGQFIPDLLLESAQNPDRKIYVEIAVTSLLSEEKERSGKQIIEVPIQQETDIWKLRKEHLTPNDAMFLGFTQISESVTDSECQCKGRKYYGFLVYQSGKSVLIYEPLLSLASFVQANSKVLLYSNLFEPLKRPASNYSDDGDDRGIIFREQLALARDRGIAVKNCYLCEHFANNYDATNKASIYCKKLRRKCESNSAASCNSFQETPNHSYMDSSRK